MFNSYRLRVNKLELELESNDCASQIFPNLNFRHQTTSKNRACNKSPGSPPYPSDNPARQTCSCEYDSGPSVTPSCACFA